MVNRRTVLVGASALALVLVGRFSMSVQAGAAQTDFAIQHSDEEWRTLLTPEQYHILREEGTERAGSSPLLDVHRDGVFACAGCGNELYSSDTKYESHTGWPSFWAPIDGAVGTRQDRSFFMARVEAHCSRCGGHLGHVFNDGPRPTGLRYCMNGLAMVFQEATT